MNQPAHVAHHVRGRIRVRLPDAKGDGPFLQRVQQSLSPRAGVHRVDVSPATGSIVVHYDRTAHPDFEQTLAQYGEDAGMFSLAPPALSEVDVLAANIEHEAEFLSQHSEVARRMVDFVKQIDHALKRASGNTVDLRVLLPLGLAVYTFLELESEITTPLWVTLGIFSFNSFVALHHVHAPHMQMESAQVIRTRSRTAGNVETTTIRKRTSKNRS